MKLITRASWVICIFSLTFSILCLRISLRSSIYAWILFFLCSRNSCFLLFLCLISLILSLYSLWFSSLFSALFDSKNDFNASLSTSFSSSSSAEGFALLISFGLFADWALYKYQTENTLIIRELAFQHSFG